MDESVNIIESPIALLPDLSSWGIEEVDKGVCMDTAENRRTIRENRARYQPVYDSNGQMTPYIQVISAEMRAAALSANKSVILTDDRDINSDYLTGTALIIEQASDHVVPAWVLSSTRHWLEVAEKRKTDPDYRPALIGPPSRCTAYKIDGNRCTLWNNGTRDYGTFCKVHLSNRPGGEDEAAGSMAKARNRLQSAASAAVEILEVLAHTAEGENIRLNAARDLLDRAGIRGGIEVDNTVLVVHSSADLVRQRLEKLREGNLAKQELEARWTGHTSEDEKPEEDSDSDSDSEIIDAEIVEETVAVKND